MLTTGPIAAEDMWHVFNLVRAGDKVTAVTFRKIAVHSAGGSESERVKIKLTISVEAVDFDPEGSDFQRSSSTAITSLGYSQSRLGELHCWVQVVRLTEFSSYPHSKAHAA